jgi:hypothetical protein
MSATLDSFGTQRRVQEEGICWLGALTWCEERQLRISNSSWPTTESDIDDCVANDRYGQSRHLGVAVGLQGRIELDAVRMIHVTTLAHGMKVSAFPVPRYRGS